MLVISKRKCAILDIKAGQKFEKPMVTAEMEAPVDPRAEWRQIFRDVYRFERDFFYDPNMHGVNWEAMGERYSKVLEGAVTRWDVDFLIGEFIGELNASHTYHGGGDMEQAPQRSVGLLGVDWELANGAYRIKRIIRGGPWDSVIRSPLDEPGVMVKEGDYVLAVNGIPIDTKSDPWASFQGLGDRTVVLTVNSSPSPTGSRQAVVKCLTNETELRFRAWIEERRQIVDKATNGRIGYIYVQRPAWTRRTSSSDVHGAMEEGRAHHRRTVEQRGQIPDRFIQLAEPSDLATGPSAMARASVAAGGAPRTAGHADQRLERFRWRCVPDLLREAGLGPLIGTRTWGGLIVSAAHRRLRWRGVTVPTFRMTIRKAMVCRRTRRRSDIVVDDDPAHWLPGTIRSSPARSKGDGARGKGSKGSAAARIREARAEAGGISNRRSVVWEAAIQRSPGSADATTGCCAARA
jgi:tricorn protease